MRWGKNMSREYASACIVATAAYLLGLATPAFAGEQGELYVTPRYWYAMSGDHRFNTTGSSIDSSEMVPVGLYGGSITYVPKSMGGTSFSLTSFYGTGNGDHRESGPAGQFLGTIEYKRLDVEALVQNPIKGSSAGWGYGVRYVNIKVGADGTDQAKLPFQFREDIKLYLGALGFGLSTPIDAAGKLRLFSNLTSVFGYRDQKHTDSCCGFPMGGSSAKNGGVIGVDTNAGFAAQLGSDLTFSARYRLFVLSDTKFNFVRETDIVHGPEVNLTLKLN